MHVKDYLVQSICTIDKTEFTDSNNVNKPCESVSDVQNFDN